MWHVYIQYISVHCSLQHFWELFRILSTLICNANYPPAPLHLPCFAFWCNFFNNESVFVDKPVSSAPPQLLLPHYSFHDVNDCIIMKEFLILAPRTICFASKLGAIRLLFFKFPPLHDICVSINQTCPKWGLRVSCGPWTGFKKPVSCFLDFKALNQSWPFRFLICFCSCAKCFHQFLGFSL